MDKSSEVYNLFEFGELDDIFIPVRNTARVKVRLYELASNMMSIRCLKMMRHN